MEEPNLLGLMPGYLQKDGVAGAKLISVFPHNHAGGKPSHQGAVALFDAKTGELLAVVDGRAITAVRTAAVSAVATRALAREDSAVLAILGTGEQAESHLEAMLQVRRIRQVRVWSRTPGKAQQFAEREGARHGVELTAASSVREAVADADIICTVTASTEPVLNGAWVRPGTHINAVGACRAERELHLNDMETILASMSQVQLQFDSADWLVKARTAEDIRQAKRSGRKAGIVTAQETDGLGRNLGLLETLHDFGLRVLQLTYNNQNLIGSGCAEQANGGLSTYGIRFVDRLNQLGVIVDTGHCGKQTTLDACRVSAAPVIASHTGAEALYPHMRCKSDEEILAIAGTGGVVGIFAMPWFVHGEPEATTIGHVLDHIDYVVRLAGVDHVGIGTDWPMSDAEWSLIYFKEYIAPRLGFAKGDGPSTETVKGLETYGRFGNFTRGLVARGYSDGDIAKITGGNWLRVFEQICG